MLLAPIYMTSTNGDGYMTANSYGSNQLIQPPHVA
jgi:hypothetical protein